MRRTMNLPAIMVKISQTERWLPVGFRRLFKLGDKR
jgi:hypothetical protein